MKLYRTAYRDTLNGRFINKGQYDILTKLDPRYTEKVRIWFWQEPKRGG